MRTFDTTTGFILSIGSPSTNEIVEVKGYTTKGDGGGAQWKHNGVTGQTVSQSPAQLADALLNDASGNQWALVFDPLINIRALGAINGSVSTLSIQAAVNAAIAFSVASKVSIWEFESISVFAPAGEYLIDAPILIDGADGISIVGDPGRGSVFTCEEDTLKMFRVGDTADVTLLFSANFKNLVFLCKTDTNTTEAIDFHNAVECNIEDCIFTGWDEAILTSRAPRLTISRCLFNIVSNFRTVKATSFISFNGNATGTGGGTHISDCEFLGSSSTDLLVDCFKITAIDGLYVNNCHFNRYNFGLHCAPDGTANANKITDLYFTNCYFDGDESPTNNIFLDGSVDVGGLYQNISFTNTYFRGALTAINGVKIAIADAGTFFSSGGRVHNIGFDRCTFKQATGQGINVSGDASFLEVEGLSITDSFFVENNASGGGISDILVIADSCTISGNTFDGSTVAGANVIQAILSAAPTGSPSLTVTDNDFTKSNYTSDEPIKFSAISGSSYLLSGNHPKGAGSLFDDIVKAGTSDATTTTIWTLAVAQPTSGYTRIVVNGSSDDSTEYASYEFTASWNRESSGSLTFATSDPVTEKSFKTSGVLTAPTFGNTSNDLELKVTGIAATDFTWIAKIENIESK